MHSKVHIALFIKGCKFFDDRYFLSTLFITFKLVYVWLIPKGPEFQNGFFGILGRLLRCQKHFSFSEFFLKGVRIYYLWREKNLI
jgi:hypothetical protein